MCVYVIYWYWGNWRFIKNIYSRHTPFLFVLETDQPGMSKDSNSKLTSWMSTRNGYSGMWTRTASGALLCVGCGHGFHSFGGLYNHIRQQHLSRHTYICSICSQGFNIKGNFIGHMNKHKGIKPFRCSNCGQSYSHKGSLQRHLRYEKCGQPKMS